MVKAATIAVLSALPALISCTESNPSANANATPASSSSTPGGVDTSPAPPSDVRTGSVSVVTSRADVALDGPRVEAKSGDWMIRGGGAIAVVSQEDGRVIDYGREGHADGLGYIDSVVWDGLDAASAEIVSIEAIGAAVHVVKRVHDRPLLLHIWTWLDGPTLRIDSMMIATGEKPVLAVTLGETYRWGNTPTWVEGHGFIDRGGTFGAEFIARESQGVAYAARSLDGPLLSRFGSPDLPGFHPSARTGEAPLTLQPGARSAPRRIAVTYSTVSLGDAASQLPEVDHEEHAARVAVAPTHLRRAALELAHCDPPLESFAKLAPASEKPKKPKGPASDAPLEHAPYARFASSETEIPIRPGCFVARWIAPGYAPGSWVNPRELSATSTGVLPTAGMLAWAVSEKGSPVPAKIVVRGLENTDDPDWGDEGEDGAAVNGIYTAEGSGSRPIPPGRYHVFVGRGPEYTLHEEDIDVGADKTVTINAKLERVVDTTGWISADLHVHAIPSFDAPVRLVDRMRSLAGVGVEVGVATDHNRITDYAPAIAEAGLRGRLASIVGDEITSVDVDFGHFNAFPLRNDAAPPPARSVVPKDLFAEMRAAGVRGGPIVIQVNHPRMSDIGYFDLLRLDPENVDRSLARSPLLETGFDALEVFNGDHYADIPKVERAMADWYALLRAGHRVTATGNSDSHKVTYQEAGVPRNWVRVPDDDPAHFDERAFIDAVRAGRVVVSNGPFVTLTAGAQGIGDTIKAGDVDVTLEVQAPPWIDVSRVELLDRGRLVRVFEGPFTASPKRFEKTFSVHLEKGDFLVAVARGEAPMQWLTRKRASPFGFTNPIWVE